jgi:hypothetical protein
MLYLRSHHKLQQKCRIKIYGARGFHRGKYLKRFKVTGIHPVDENVFGEDEFYLHLSPTEKK